MATLLISQVTLNFLESNDPSFVADINSTFAAEQILASDPPSAGPFPELSNYSGTSLYLTNANAFVGRGWATSGIASVVYDPENWSQTPVAQQQNTVAFIKLLASEAHGVGATLNITPAPNLEAHITPDTSLWPQLLLENVLLPAAPYVDSITLQFQRFERDPAQFELLVAQAVTALHGVNPDLKIYVDMSTNPVWGVSNQNLVAEYQAIAHITDGIWFTNNIWFSPNGGGLSQAEYFFDHIAPMGIVGATYHAGGV